MKSKKWLPKFLKTGTLAGTVILSLLFFGNVAYAAASESSVQAPQTETINGTVVDDAGAPVVGAAVLQKGTSNGTITDIDGKFSLNVTANSTIVVSCIGYVSQEVVVSENDIIITLAEDNVLLDEVVVVGYGTLKKRDVTGSISQTKGSEIAKVQAFSPLDGLRGKAAGVNIYSNSSQPGAYANRVVIRGVATINSSTDPLYVVDGVVMEDFHLLNPNDIKSIEVLKDASAAAIYGARGANGVIIVTTERGLVSEGTKITYAGSLTVSQPARYMNTLTASEWCDAFMQGLENENKYQGKNWSLNRTDWFTNRDYFDASGNPIYDTNWQKEATRVSVSHNHQVNLQHTTAKTSTGAFLNFTDQQGIMKNTYSKRLNGKLAFDAKPTKWLSTNTNLLVNHTWGRYTPETGGGQECRRTMIEMLPWLPVRDKDGNYTTNTSVGADMQEKYGFEGMSNPVMILDLQKRMNYRTQIFGNQAFTFHILPGLDLKTQIGVDAHLNTYRGYSSKELNNISMPNGWASISHTNSIYWQEETYLTWNKEFNENHRLNLMAGLSWQGRTQNYDSMYTEGFTSDFYEWNNMGAGTMYDAPESSYSNWKMNSYFIRAAYTLLNKYSLTATARYDGSSKFGANNKYAFFPSAGLAWNVKEEDWLKDSQAVSEFRVHTSYGITGNSEINPYNSLAKASSSTTLINNVAAPYSYMSSMANSDLKWEKTAQWDAGFNIGFFNNRLYFDLSYYNKKTSDLLLNCPIPSQSGFSSIFKNIGSVSNQGVDIMIKGIPVFRKNFEWNVTLNANYNKNKVLHLGENDEDIEMYSWVGGSEAIIRVGESLNSFYGYRRYGTWTEADAAAGKCDWNQVGRAHRSDTKEIIGKGTPDWSGSFINNFRLYNFDLTIDMQFVAGVQTMQQFYHSTYDRFGITNGLNNILYDAATGTQSRMQQMVYLCNPDHAGQDTTVDSAWIVDGSYLRANLIQLGYTFPKTVMQNASLRLYLNVNNAFLITSKDFTGFDPESTSNRDDVFGQNMAFFSYPRARAFTFGVNLTF